VSVTNYVGIVLGPVLFLTLCLWLLIREHRHDDMKDLARRDRDRQWRELP
jgi:hypothetical protein